MQFSISFRMQIFPVTLKVNILYDIPIFEKYISVENEATTFKVISLTSGPVPECSKAKAEKLEEFHLYK